MIRISIVVKILNRKREGGGPMKPIVYYII